MSTPCKHPAAPATNTQSPHLDTLPSLPAHSFPLPYPRSGFCRHQVPGFGPWHRAYLRQFELALLDSARVAASQFRDQDLRKQYEAVAETIRIPYWDW